MERSDRELPTLNFDSEDFTTLREPLTLLNGVREVFIRHSERYGKWPSPKRQGLLRQSMNPYDERLETIINTILLLPKKPEIRAIYMGGFLDYDAQMRHEQLFPGQELIDFPRLTGLTNAHMTELIASQGKNASSQIHAGAIYALSMDVQSFEEQRASFALALEIGTAVLRGLGL